MHNTDMQKRIQAAHALLMEETTTREKFSHIRSLIAGINTSLDARLEEIEKHLSTWDKVQEGEVIHLSAEHLPENTEEEKKRKKWLLLFITSWKRLKGEVARVEAAMQEGSNVGSTGEKASMWGKIFGAAKGPLGLITVLAVGVALLNQSAVALTIENQGCATMYPSGSIPAIPGFSLPKDPIPSGGSAVAEIPGLPVSVDGTAQSALTISILTYTLTFELPSDIADVTLNGTSLLGKKTEVKLSEKDTHVLKLVCS